MSSKLAGSVQRRTLQVVKQSTAADAQYELALPGVASPACGRCGGCASAFAASDTTPIKISLPESLLVQQNVHPLKVGQSLEMQVPSAMLLSLSSVIYLLPVVLMLFFAVSCDLLFAASESQVAGSAVVGLCLGLVSTVVLEPALRSFTSKRLRLCNHTDSTQ